MSEYHEFLYRAICIFALPVGVDKSYKKQQSDATPALAALTPSLCTFVIA
jgi:hypothetical protein